MVERHLQDAHGVLLNCHVIFANPRVTPSILLASVTDVIVHPNKVPTIPRDLLTRMFEAAIKSAQPAICLPRFLPMPPKGRTLVIGAGKASAAMAKALEDNWTGSLTGLIVTRYGYSVPCKHIEVVEAAHPVPDEAGLSAAKRILSMAQSLTADDLVICLISGGGSALLPCPHPGIDLQIKQDLSRLLLKSGATISEINCVRRHLSMIKGGRLAAACYPAKVINLLISDVPGDRPVDIASGPTVADPTTCGNALSILDRYEIPISAELNTLLSSGEGESIKPDDPRISRVETHVIATPQRALEAATVIAKEAGYAAYILSDAIEGEARDVGKVLGAMALHVAQRGQPFSAPCVLLSGGETTVTVRGSGRGGRNVEYLLSLGITLDGHPGIHALAGDTDGVDGQEEIAGAYLSPDTLSRAWHLGMRPRDALDNNDAHSFFSKLGDSIVTGPTLTNVNDFRAILIGNP